MTILPPWTYARQVVYDLMVKKINRNLIPLKCLEADYFRPKKTWMNIFLKEIIQKVNKIDFFFILFHVRDSWIKLRDSYFNGLKIFFYLYYDILYEGFVDS